MTTSEAALQREAPGGERGYSRVYVWHWPVRVFHWSMVASMVVLAVTGLYIGRPYFIVAPTTTTPFMMGWMRFFHFLAAAVLVGAVILRLYAMVMGNRYERWNSLLPVKKSDWVNFFKMGKKYLMQDWWSPPHYLGHNPMQQLSYTFMYFVIVFMALTGFALYGQANPNGFWWTVTTSWVMPLLGGNQWVRLLHHFGVWVVVTFVVLHVYLAVRSDVLYDRGAVSSIISGFKFKHDRADYKDVD